MDCEICLEEFDHTIHRPFSLSPCMHTLCISCLNNLSEKKCPLCTKVINDNNTNWTLLKLVPESTYDKLKSNCENQLNKLISINGNLDLKRKDEIEKISKKIDKIRSQINVRLNDLINLIQKQKLKLMDQTENIENYLEKRMFNYSGTHLTQEETSNIKNHLDNNSLSESDLKKLAEQLNDSINETNEKLDFIDKVNYDDYEFIEADFVDADPNLFGEITNKQWLNEPLTASNLVKIGFEINEQLKDYKKSILLFNKAIEIEPNFSFPYYKKGLFLLEQKKYDGSIECFDKCLQLNPHYANAFDGKGK